MKAIRCPRVRRGIRLLAVLAPALLLASACSRRGDEHALETCVYGKAISADGLAIRYECRGAGDPALVFIHCWCGDRSYWRRQMDAFQDGHRVVALDLAGHGESAGGRERWSVEAFAGDVVAVVEKLDLRGAILVGHSLGGPVAVEAARRLPDRVIGVIGVDTLHDLGRRYPEPQIEAFLTPLREDFPATVVSFVRGMFPDGADSSLVESVAADMAKSPPEMAVAALGELLRHDLRPALQELRAPIRCIDADTYPVNLEENRRLAGSYEVVVMDGVGHFPFLERPDEFDAHLAAMAADLTARAAETGR